MGAPIGLRAIRRCGPSLKNRESGYRLYVLLITFFCYTSYHLSRKAISVVKSTWHPVDCNETVASWTDGGELANSTSCTYWAPFTSATSLGNLDFVYLLSYAVAMFFSGQIGDRVNLRYFLFAGMVLSGAFTSMLGLAYFFRIHVYWYFVIAQLFGGMVQSTGWPSVVAVTANWLGKGHRGLIMGLWNAHTSVGNILGAIIPGIWARGAWGWSFIVPGLIIASMGVIVLFFLVVDPRDVDCSPPQHHDPDPDPEDADDEAQQLLSDQHVTNGFNQNTHRPSSLQVSCKSGSPHTNEKEASTEQAVTFWSALRIPGVVEFALCLFFSKFVCYIFLFWLPYYVRDVQPDGRKISREDAAFYSSLFDVGGIVGGVLAGVVSDRTGARAMTCVVMLLVGAPSLWLFRVHGGDSLASLLLLLTFCGALVNGPYALITTAVSADLGTHKVLRNSHVAKATVAAIIDGTGSLGAALGPYTTGYGLQDSGWNTVFFVCMGALLAAALLLSRLCVKEAKRFIYGRTSPDSYDVC